MKPNLLLLHGWAFDSSCFSRLIPLLENSFSIHAPDLEPVWDRRINALQELIQTEKGEWYGCGWSMGFLLTSELRRRGLLSKNCGITAVPDFSCRNGLPEATVNRMLEGLKNNPAKVLRRFSLLTAHPGKPVQHTAGGRSEYLIKSLVYLRDGGCRETDPGTPVLLAAADAVLETQAAGSFPELAVTLVKNTGHDLPLSAPESVAGWLNEILL